MPTDALMGASAGGGVFFDRRCCAGMGTRRGDAVGNGEGGGGWHSPEVLTWGGMHGPAAPPPPSPSCPPRVLQPLHRCFGRGWSRWGGVGLRGGSANGCTATKWPGPAPALPRNAAAPPAPTPGLFVLCQKRREFQNYS